MLNIVKIFITIILVSASIVTNIARAQDIIVLKNGSVIKSKVQEITTNEIKYKKISNLSGPLFIVDKSEVFSINFENGMVENYVSYKSASTDSKSLEVSSGNNIKSTIIIKPADADNSALLLKYNREIEPVKLKKVKNRQMDKNYQYVSYGLTANSTISNEDIEISFERTNYYDIPDSRSCNYAYNIVIRNKTSETICLDLAQSARTESDGSYRIYYDPSQVKSTMEGGTSLSTINLGLVSMGGGIAGSTSTIYNPQSQIVIPAKSIGYFSKLEIKAIKTGEGLFSAYFKYVTVSEGEFLANKKISTRAYVGEVVTFTEVNSPYKLKYKILYSKEKNPKELCVMKFSLYVHQLFGYENWKNIFGSYQDQDNFIIMKNHSFDKYNEPTSCNAVKY